jgi:hypothetical protein
MGLTLTAARADMIIQYQFNPGALMTIDSIDFAISGDFDYDVGLSQPTGVDITLFNGTLSETFSTISNQCLNSSGSVCAANIATGDFMGVGFTASLSNDSLDQIIVANNITGCACENDFPDVIGSASSVTGSAQPVPEPTSLALLSVGLLGIRTVRGLRAPGRTVRITPVGGMAD